MSSTVEFSVLNGESEDTTFRINGRMTCIMGREDDCNLQLPEDDLSVSRHHCILDLNPPVAVVRDFGSSNGTFVNGKNISEQGPSESKSSNGYVLEDGDRLEIGRTLISVSIKSSVCCKECGIKLDKERGDSQSENVLCDACSAASSVGETNNLVDGFTDESYEINNYKIVRKLASEGVSTVYLAIDKKTNEEVALKTMNPLGPVGKASLDNFLREMDNARSLDHPNIIKLLDSGYYQGAFYYTMDYCEMGSVFDYIEKNRGPLELGDAIGVINQVLRGLDHAHNQEIPYVKLETGVIQKGKGLIHRDINPKNIYILEYSNRGIVKIGDFGLSKAFDLAGLSGCTMTGDAEGAPFFMSRVQMLDFKYAKPSVDIWAAAATLYYMLTAKYPRDFPMGVDPIIQVLESETVPILENNVSVSKKLAQVIDLALDDSNGLHFQSAKDFKLALDKALE